MTQTTTNFDTSFTRKGLHCTEIDEDPQGKLDASPELQALLEEEISLGTIPDWAQEIVTRMIGSPLVPCGHYAFPAPMVQIIKAIGQELCPAFVMGCYTADPTRKRRLQAVIYCLDAWLHNAPLETTSWELDRHNIDGKDWTSIVKRIYIVLGEEHPLRTLLIKRLIHRLRWWVKTHSWESDPRTQFGLDQYLGDPRGDGDWGNFGDPELRDPYFVEFREPDVVAVEEQIRTEVPNGEILLGRIQATWLCAPKSFRYIERVLIEIGSIGTSQMPEFSQKLLDCDDTYPDFRQAQSWEAKTLSELSDWLTGNGSAMRNSGQTRRSSTGW